MRERTACWRAVGLAVTVAACGATSHPETDAGQDASPEPADAEAVRDDAGAHDDAGGDAGPPACPPLALLEEGAVDHEGLEVWPAVSAVVTSDLDRDGDPDFVVAGYDPAFGAGSLGVLLGDGAGSVEVVAPVPDSDGLWSERSFATPDLDADGVPDLVGVSCPEPGVEGELAAYRGLGDGSFDALPRASVGLHHFDACPTVSTLHTAGNADRVVVAIGRYLGVFVGAGAEALRESWTIFLNAQVFGLTAVDLDDDGADDFVLEVGGDLLVFDALADGSFGPRPAMSAEALGGPGIASGDLDEDGDPDVVMYGHLFRNDGNGTLEAAGASPLWGFLTDVDDDGDLDGVWYSTVILNDGVGQSEGGPTITLWGIAALGAADLDLDGDTDLFGYDPLIPGRFVVVANLGDGHFFREGLQTSSYPESLVVADLNGDADLDVAVGGDDGITCLWGVGDATFEVGPALGKYLERPEVLVALDLEDDGDLDLVRVEEYGSSELWLNDGTGEFVAGVPPDNLGYGFEAGTVGDLDADGRPDLALANNQGSLWLLWNDGTADLAGPDTVAVDPGAESLVLADLDGDGDLDIATANDVASTVSIVENLGQRGLAAARSFAIDGPAEAIAAGDIDADGFADLVVADNGGEVSVFANDGAAEFSPSSVLDAEGDPRAVALVDLDGDGDLDLAVACEAANLVRLYPNDEGMFGESVEVGVGTSPFALSFGELDGRCGVDMVAANKSSFDVTVVLAAHR